MYYSKIIKRNKLIKLWILLGGQFIYTFRSNYKMLSSLYDQNCFLNINSLYFSIKSILPIFLNIYKFKSNCLFIATRYIYSKIVTTNKNNSIIKILLEKNSGIINNPSFYNFKSNKYQKIAYNSSILVFFYAKENNKLIIEGKKKNIPIIGLINSTNNSAYIDYPITVNTNYFYTIYFFSKLFFRYIYSLENETN